MTRKFDRIVCEEGVCAGAPCLKGHRINIFNLICRLMNESPKSFLEDYPDLQLDDIRQAIEYCKTRECRNDNPTHFCDGCSLRREFDKETFQEFLSKFGQVGTSDFPDFDLDEGGLLFAGNIAQLKKKWQGEDGWKLAARVAAKNADELR